MRIILGLFPAVLLSFGVLYAQEMPSSYGDNPQVTTFEEAFLGYNTASTQKDLHLTTHYAQKSYELGLEKFGNKDKNTVNLVLNWINAYTAHSQEHDSPIEKIKIDFPDLEKTQTGDPSTLINIYMAYGSYFLKSHERIQSTKAIAYYKKAIEIVEKFYEGNNVAIAMVNLEVGKNLYSAGGAKESKEYIQKARELFAKDPNKNAFNLAIANFWTAKYFLSTKSNNKAADFISEALKTLDDVDPTGQYALASHAFMIEILEKQGKRGEATKHCQMIGKAQPIDVNREQIPLYRFSPNYPRLAAERGTAGEVIIEFTVDAEGFVKNPRAIHGTHIKIFAPEAIKAVKEYRFAPRYVDGKPVSTDGLITRFTFHMRR